MLSIILFVSIKKCYKLPFRNILKLLLIYLSKNQNNTFLWNWNNPTTRFW